YIVVAGWTLEYLFKAASMAPGAVEQAAALADNGYWERFFGAFVAHPFLPIACMAVFVLMSHFVIVRGVEKGIERFSKVLMPLLFIILIALVVCSLFTEGAAAGLAFLFKPDFSKVTLRMVLAAMGQAFFSMSIGMGCLCTYASYFGRDTDLLRTALHVGAIDTLVAIMSGIVIFPAVFSTGIRPDAGASLVFIALPNVFQEAFSALPWLGYAVSVLFYALLVLATLTSVISLHEVPTAYLTEDFHLSRRTATTAVTIVVMALGTLCSLSMGPLKGMTLFGRNLFDLFDWTSSQILLPLGGALITFFAAWVLNRSVLRRELTNDGTLPYGHTRLIVALLRYFAPFVIFLILISGLGLL
ncbi:MAG: sodium-dependent transporter, partial [Alloprevotella sp.]|nr:sodium-dependent transporter [Alloprevotella sp.]